MLELDLRLVHLVLSHLRPYPVFQLGVTATLEDSSAVVYWTAPADNGGAPITQYTVTSDPGGLIATSAGTSAAVTGMTKIFHARSQ